MKRIYVSEDTEKRFKRFIQPGETQDQTLARMLDIMMLFIKSDEKAVQETINTD